MITARTPLKDILAFSMAIGILVLGLFLRIDTVHNANIQKDLTGDSHIYFTYARNLHEHGVYSRYNHQENGIYSHTESDFGNSVLTPPSDNFGSPGYPLFISLFLSNLPDALNDESIKPTLYKIKYAQAILSAVTVLITFFIARPILGNILALVPMFIVAIAPHLIIANLYILTETVFCFLLSLVILLIGWVHRTPPFYNIFVGALIAVGSLVKPAFLYFIIPLAAVYFFLILKQFRRSSLCFLVLGFALVFSPWIIRNQISDDMVSDKNLMAISLLAGAYPDLMYRSDPQTYPYPFLHDPNFQEYSHNTASAIKEIGRRFLDGPSQLAKWYLVGKPILLWQWDITHGIGGAFVYRVNYSPYNSSVFYRFTYIASKVMHWPLVILGLIGCVIAWLPSRHTLLPEKSMLTSRVISITLLYFLFIHIVTFAEARYAVPLRPLLSIMALLTTLYLSIQVKKFSRLKNRNAHHSAL